MDKDIMPIIQGEEITDWCWVELYDLFKEDSEYELPFDMKDHLRRVLDYRIDNSKVMIKSVDNQN